jgi:hypothetical protein
VFNTNILHCYVAGLAYLRGMPNKRHPAKEFIGLWATAHIKNLLKSHAKEKKQTLSVLIERVLRDKAKIILLKNKAKIILLKKAEIILLKKRKDKAEIIILLKKRNDNGLL